MNHIIPSALNNPSSNHLPVPNGEPVEVADLNYILKQALLKIKDVMEGHSIIMRCDQLPVIEGRQQDFLKLFQTIMQFVLSRPPVASKQFLYIKCEEEELAKEVMDLSGPAKTYIIQFYTNTSFDAYWQAGQQPLLAQCEQIANSYSGSFAYTQFNSGCLFTLRLSGKPI